MRDVGSELAIIWTVDPVQTGVGECADRARFLDSADTIHQRIVEEGDRLLKVVFNLGERDGAACDFSCLSNPPL